ncbi:MAG: alpha-L-fucosidase [Rikenellaceae bacterium]
MKNTLKKSVLAIAALVGTLSCSSSYTPNIESVVSPKGNDLYKADSLSIAQNYTIPEWFRDAKFGIFIHWGVYSVPAYGSEWYSRLMYEEGSDINKYHRATYGPVTEFGYKDFIPMFKAENFDADEWLEVFKASGARYVVPVAEHHDGFAMYDSSFNPWCASKMGPERDIIGEIKVATQKAGLLFGLSSHRCENAWFYEFGMQSPSDVQDLSISLYGERLHEPGFQGMNPEYGQYEGSNEKSRQEWLMHTYELIDKYQPELMWFDWTVGKYPFQPTFYKYMAYYYNSAIDWGKEVVVNTKFGYDDSSQVFDIERGKSDEIRNFAWQTDTSVGKKSWSYTVDEENKSPNHIIDDFVDIVSKNGNLLLNVGPTASGQITQEQKDVLYAIGDWLAINGEAIFCSRPWIVATEGDNGGTAGYMTDNQESHYTHQDIRFTTNGNTLYAISLAWSDEDTIIKSLKGVDIRGVEQVSMLGSEEELSYLMSDNGLIISAPKKMPCDYAHVFKIVFKEEVPEMLL